jgi:hypothetical protein
LIAGPYQEGLAGGAFQLTSQPVEDSTWYLENGPLQVRVIIVQSCDLLEYALERITHKAEHIIHKLSPNVSA